MAHRYEIIKGPSKAELIAVFSENTEREQKNVTFTVANPSPGNGHPDTVECNIAIFLLHNYREDGEHWQFRGRLGFPFVEGEFNTASSRGFIIF